MPICLTYATELVSERLVQMSMCAISAGSLGHTKQETRCLLLCKTLGFLAKKSVPHFLVFSCTSHLP